MSFQQVKIDLVPNGAVTAASVYDSVPACLLACLDFPKKDRYLKVKPPKRWIRLVIIGTAWGERTTSRSSVSIARFANTELSLYWTFHYKNL